MYFAKPYFSLMKDLSFFKKNIFQLKNETDFEKAALALFQFQARENPVYKNFLQYLHIAPQSVNTIDQIPFLPIELFKNHKIVSGDLPIEQVFTSSGTTGITTSYHYVADTTLYIDSFMQGFQHFYGNIQDYCLLALLPAYLERKGSSLVFMADHLIRQTQHPLSGFYLDDYAQLQATLQHLTIQKQKTILLGVSFALWEFAEQYPMPLPYITIMETGGMKGRRKEVVKEQLHHIFKEAFGVPSIHSEYGMTELLSQAYSKGNNLFECPPWMKVLIREVNDPFAYQSIGQTGCINVIDLANVYSCAFIATSDLGKCHTDGTFEVLGRLDSSDVRGCNLLFF